MNQFEKTKGILEAHKKTLVNMSNNEKKNSRNSFQAQDND